MKKKLFIILGVFVVNISLVLFFTLKKEDNNVISKEETFKTSELPNEIMAYTLNGEKTSLSYNALINNNTVNKITCKNGTIATFNSSDKSISFSNIKMPDYCTIDFNHTFYSKLLVDNPKVETRTDFSTPFTSNIANTLYKATENGEDVYYFAGSDKTNKINNWVYFGGYYWRIIRTNYDSSIRLLYVGTSKDTTTGYIGKSSYSNSSRDPMNVGYMYGTTGSLDNNRTNENNSLIKEYIDNWYDGTRTIVNSTYQKEYTDESTNKLIDYSKYISTEAIYCNDRSTAIYNMSSYFQYGAGTRVHSNKKPSYDCGKNTSTNAWIGGSQSVDDMFTYTSSNVGNKKLKYPIGLMTSDEIIYAGGIFTGTPIDGLWYTQNSAGNNVNSSNWWTLSPRYFSGDTAFPYEVETGGNLIGEGGAGSILGVRPVISLKGNLIWKSGDGSSESPYEVELPPTTLYDAILSDNLTISERTNFNTTFTTTNTGTLYKATESITGSTAKDVYYFAGNATNNWVKFGGFYWRIIRTNHDGSVRLLYSGTATDTTSGYIGISAFNSTFSDPMYVGYMYGTSGTQASNRTNENNSTIKIEIDAWYKNNLLGYTKYLSTEAVYCNDREVGEGTYTTTKSSRFNYASYTRIMTNKKPTYDCTNIKDALSGSNTEAKLTYPIALMTADEIVFAGGKSTTSLISPYAWYYLNSAGESITATTWWVSMSPMFWVDVPYVWYVIGSHVPGSLAGSYPVDYENYGIRPVISIKSDAIWSSGDGSPENPYEIVYN